LSLTWWIVSVYFMANTNFEEKKNHVDKI
jgi:hypothetical protein